MNSIENLIADIVHPLPLIPGGSTNQEDVAAMPSKSGAQNPTIKEKESKMYKPLTFTIGDVLNTNPTKEVNVFPVLPIKPVPANWAPSYSPVVEAEQILAWDHYHWSTAATAIELRSEPFMHTILEGIELGYLGQKVGVNIIQGLAKARNKGVNARYKVWAAEQYQEFLTKERLFPLFTEQEEYQEEVEVEMTTVSPEAMTVVNMLERAILKSNPVVKVGRRARQKARRTGERIPKQVKRTKKSVPMAKVAKVLVPMFTVFAVNVEGEASAVKAVYTIKMGNLTPELDFSVFKEVKVNVLVAKKASIAATKTRNNLKQGLKFRALIEGNIKDQKVLSQGVKMRNLVSALMTKKEV